MVIHEFGVDLVLFYLVACIEIGGSVNSILKILRSSSFLLQDHSVRSASSLHAFEVSSAVCSSLVFFAFEIRLLNLVNDSTRTHHLGICGAPVSFLRRYVETFLLSRIRNGCANNDWLLQTGDLDVFACSRATKYFSNCAFLHLLKGFQLTFRYW